MLMLRQTTALTILVTTISLLSRGCPALLIDEDAARDAVEYEQSAPQSDESSDETSNTNANEDGVGPNSPGKNEQARVTLVGLEDILNLGRSGIVGLGHDHLENSDEDGSRLNYNQLHANDMIENSIFDPFNPDPSCAEGNNDGDGGDCWHPPDSTVEEEIVQVPLCEDDGTSPSGLETLAWGYGGADPDEDEDQEQEGEQEECVEEIDGEEQEGNGDKKAQCGKPSSDEQTPTTDANAEDESAQCDVTKTKSKIVDKHWGSDLNVLKMRDRLRGRRGKYWDLIEQEEQDLTVGNETNATQANQTSSKKEESFTTDKRPPVFLIPGLASTRLVSWKHKPCQNALLSDIKMLEHVWLNMNLLIQMATIDASCWCECLTLGKYQTDYDVPDDKQDDPQSHGCKLRPDEGLDSISSLAPGSISSNLFVGGTNTVYAWLIQWLADNLGYDVSSIVALPYDWRLSPEKIEERDGFLTLTRKKIEAAVESNGMPGIMVAHSMGNSVFRYFLEWLRSEMREEAYQRYARQAKESAATQAAALAEGQGPFWRRRALYQALVNPGDIVSHEADKNINSDNAYLDDLEQSLGSNDDDGDEQSSEKYEEDEQSRREYPKLYELAKVEGDTEWISWLGKHIETYVGLAAPLLGAVGPLRSVLSGENMGLPFTDEEARVLELSFGSTSTANSISTKMGFCDGDDVESAKAGQSRSKGKKQNTQNLACLEELISGIESSKGKTNNPWKNFPALRLLLKERVDFDTAFPTVQVEREICHADEKQPCKNQTKVDFGPKDIMNGDIFQEFSEIWNEKGEPLKVKLDQLRQSWWQGKVPNMLETPPDRPHIKHVILAYGTDLATEIGYVYKKTDQDTGNSTIKTDEFDGIPEMKEVIWEERHGRLVAESQVVEPTSFKDTLLRKNKKKDKRRPFTTADGKAATWLHHSGDGTIPYISLMWAHTWLLHATRAMRSLNSTASMLEGERISNPTNVLDSIKVSHRPKGGSEWLEGYGAERSEEDTELPSEDGDTGTSHPHGTKYKPKMVRFQSRGKSRSTGMEYTTTVIEAIAVEHKEITRNYDILAAAFTDVLKNLHDDYDGFI